MVFVGYVSLQAAQSDAPAISLPAGAVKIMDKTSRLGPSNSIVQTYETALSSDKINDFYKKEMAKNGWRQEKDRFFLKDGYLAVIVPLPGKSETGKNRFVLTLSSLPSKEDIMAQRKIIPDKVNFMPIYPGSVQVFLWETPTGVSGSYETESSLPEIIFFYKSGMLNYGWSLAKETPVKTEPIDCPECKKAAGAEVKGSSDKASLVFRKASGDSCFIRLFRSSIAGEETTSKAGDIPELSIPAKTIILVSYNENKSMRR